MDDFTAMKKRISRRVYLSDSIPGGKIRKLKEKIADCNQKSGLSIFFLENGEDAFNSILKSYGMFSGVRSLIVMKGPYKDRHLFEKIGHEGEAIVLEAIKMGLSTCWVGGTFDKNCALFELKKSEKLACVITIGNSAEEKNLRENLIYRLTHRKIKAIEERYTSDTTPPDWFINGMEALILAPSAINSQKPRLEFKDGAARISVPGTAASDMIDLGIAKLHFELAAEGTFRLGNNAEFSQGISF